MKFFGSNENRLSLTTEQLRAVWDRLAVRKNAQTAVERALQRMFPNILLETAAPKDVRTPSELAGTVATGVEYNNTQAAIGGITSTVIAESGVTEPIKREKDPASGEVMAADILAQDARAQIKALQTEGAKSSDFGLAA